MLVIKAGGAAGINLQALANDVARLVRGSERIVLVHGGSFETNVLCAQLGIRPQFLESRNGIRSRYTDAATLEALTMALAGRVNPNLVARLAALGVKAVGLAGVDGAVLRARPKRVLKGYLDRRPRVIRDDLSGKIIEVNTDLLRLLLDAGYVPVISPPAVSAAGELLNVDADRAASAVAVALSADHLVILSNVPGLLRDEGDPASLVAQIREDEIAHYEPAARGRMALKLMGARDAIAGGVQRVTIADGRGVSPVYKAIEGQGTVFQAAPKTIAHGRSAGA